MIRFLAAALLLASVQANAGSPVMALECSGEITRASYQVSLCQGGNWQVPDQLPARESDRILVCFGDYSYRTTSYLCEDGHTSYDGPYSLQYSWKTSFYRSVAWLL